MPEITLAEPGSTQDLYLARGADDVIARPIMTGDVFTGVDLDFDEHDGRVMVVGHPCAIRGAQGQLRPRVVVAPVTPYQSIPFRRWPKGEYGVLPLPEMLDDDDRPRATHLHDLNAVRSARLDRANRILSLKDRGIYVLIQRFVFAHSRVAVGLDRIQEQAGTVLLEAELEAEWVEDLADLDDPGSIEHESREYAQFMDEGARHLLYDPTSRADTIRDLRREIKSRQASA